MNINVLKAYSSIGRVDIGSGSDNIDQEGYNYWSEQEQANPSNFLGAFNYAVDTNISSMDHCVNYLVTNAYNSFGRFNIGTGYNNIDQGGFDYWKGQIVSGVVKASEFTDIFSSGVLSYITSNPTNGYSEAMQAFIDADTFDLPSVVHVVAYGDSTTKQDPVNNIITYTQAHVPETRIVLDNRGIPSTTVSDLIASNVDTDIGDIVLLNYSLNEAYRGTTPSQFKTDLTSLVQEFLDKDKLVVLQTPNKVDSTAWGLEVYKYAEVVREVALENHTYLQDKFGQDTLLVDGIHPTNSAYETQAIELAGILNNIYETYNGV